MALVTAGQFNLAPDIGGAIGRGQQTRAFSQELANQEQLKQLAGQQAQTRRTSLGVPEERPEDETQVQAQLRLIADDPKGAKEALDTVGIVNQTQREDAARFASQTLNAPTPEIQTELINRRVQEITSRGGDASQTLGLLEQTPEQRKLSLRGLEALALTAMQREETGLKRETLAQSLRKTEADLKKTKTTGDQKVFDNTKKIRDEFTKSSGEFVKTRDSFNRVQASADDPSAAGDLSLIFNFMKVLDPGSVVRESEFATAQNAAGVPERIRAQYGRVLEGERLSDKTRNDFVNRANKLFATQSSQHKKRTSEFTKLSNSFGIDPANVIIDLTTPEQAGQPTGDLNPDEQAELIELKQRLGK